MGTMRGLDVLGPAALVGGLLATMMVPRAAPAGTVAEQRARLPPPAQCSDTVAGVWKSHDFRGHRGVWEVFTLRIRRKDATTLVGTIHNQYWFGDADDAEPGVCEGGHHAEVSMDAEGTIFDATINFHGVGQFRVDKVHCGSTSIRYVLDNFTGEIDPELLEFQSLANDGIVAINEPTVFRRIDCHRDDEDPAGAQGPRVVVAPPDFYPPEDPSSGAAGCASR